MDNIVLSTKGLTKNYGTLTAVKNLNLEVYKDEIFGFLGPNGAGKTTSINMMSGLLKPDAGQVFINNKPVTSGDAKVRSRVGVCPQDNILWPKLTCFEQLVFVGQMYGVSKKEVSQNATMLLNEMGLMEKKNKKAQSLSGGMKRRLNLAMSLVHNPDIVILDEPEAGLDPQSRIKVREFIQSMGREKTIVVTTHNMDEADRIANRVAIIDHGILLALDTPEALKKSIGKGDILEILLESPTIDHVQIKEIISKITDKSSISIEKNWLTIRALNIIHILPEIINKLSGIHIQCREIRLRENTLEDVFIQLTGRRLRE